MDAKIVVLSCLVGGWGLAAAGDALAEVLVVSEDGSGDYDTIAEAIEAAESGDLVRVLAGQYAEEGDDGEPTVARVADRSVCLEGVGDVRVTGLRVVCSAGGDLVVRSLLWHDQYGSALYAASDGILTVEDCRFERLSGFTAAAIDMSSTSLCTIRGCVFEECTSTLGPGAIEGGFQLLVEGCEFYGCSAPRAGAISAFGDSEIIDCIISKCSASDGGVIEGEEIVIDGLTCWDNDCLRGAIYDPYGAYYDAITVRNSIIGETSSGIAIESNGGGVWLRCLDILDETWFLAGTWGWSDVFSEDPLFCHPEARDFGLDVNSPCAPWNGPEDCDRIGARDVECGVTPVVESSWGAIKGRFR